MEPSTWLLGYFTRNRMSMPPHSEWFTSGYEEYQADADVLNKLKNIDKNNLVITIVLGSWCPDSRREVPRFMKIIDQWSYPYENITFIGVDDQKIAPIGNFEELEIKRVPTFIFFKNNIEAGRIIEVPETSLEQDMVNILTKE
jgi:thiol-disulfide isomerase/thioredoxin